MFKLRLKKLRESKKLSQQELSKIINVAQSTIGNWESGIREPSLDTIKLLADYFNVSVDYLVGNSNEPTLNEVSLEKNMFDIDNIFPIETKKIPLLGDIACGVPIYADEERESYIEAGTNINADFCLRAKGDSMINARINDGDIVFIKSQSDVDNGEIAVVIIDDEATLKRVYKKPNSLVLMAENPNYEPLIYSKHELDEIRILGKAVAFQSDVK